jgi:hypothetical protein
MIKGLIIPFKKRMVSNTTDLCLNLNKLSHKPSKNLARKCECESEF